MSLAGHLRLKNLPGFRWRAGILLMLSAVAALGIYAWIVLFKTCDVEAVKDASTFLHSQLVSYDRVYDSAVSGTPTSLVYPISVMQKTRVDTQAVTVPACLRRAQDELVGYMDAVLGAFHAYQSGEPETVIRDWLGRSDRHYDHYRQEVRAVNACAPYCLMQILRQQ